MLHLSCQNDFNPTPCFPSFMVAILLISIFSYAILCMSQPCVHSASGTIPNHVITCSYMYNNISWYLRVAQISAYNVMNNYVLINKQIIK